MKTIKVQKLKDEPFRKYGVDQNLLDSEGMKARTFPMGSFRPDLITLDFGKDMLPTISVCDITKPEKMEVGFLEYHSRTCEGILPLDDDVVIFVGLCRGELTVDCIEAFYVPVGTFVKMNPMVVHGVQFPAHKEGAHVVCMLPGRTFHNDCTIRVLEREEEKAQLVL